MNSVGDLAPFTPADGFGCLSKNARLQLPATGRRFYKFLVPALAPSKKAWCLALGSRLLAPGSRF